MGMAYDRFLVGSHSLKFILKLFIFSTLSHHAHFAMAAPYIDVSSELRSIQLNGAIDLNTPKVLLKHLKNSLGEKRHSEGFRLSRERRKEIADLVNNVPNKLLYRDILTSEQIDHIQLIVQNLLMLEIRTLSINSIGGTIGGSSAPMLQLAAIVDSLQLSIVIPEKGFCASACTYIIAHGSTISMSTSAQLLYHFATQTQGTGSHINTCRPGLEDCKIVNPINAKPSAAYIKWIETLPDGVLSKISQGQDFKITAAEALSLKMIDEITYETETY